LAKPVGAKQITAWLSDEPMISDKLEEDEFEPSVPGEIFWLPASWVTH
jgi:hypothetical protein